MIEVVDFLALSQGQASAIFAADFPSWWPTSMSDCSGYRYDAIDPQTNRR
jgi:hypothetical protein